MAAVANVSDTVDVAQEQISSVLALAGYTPVNAYYVAIKVGASPPRVTNGV